LNELNSKADLVKESILCQVLSSLHNYCINHVLLFLICFTKKHCGV